MNYIHFKEIDSTNSYLKRNSESLENFTFVSTDYQNKGKGRENRIWYATKNENLLFSFIIKEKGLLEKYKSLSIGTATLVARFLEIYGLKNVMVKWPNDVYVNGKKICGILLEGNVSSYIVIGVGLNLNQIVFEDSYRVTPTSVTLETNKKVDIDDFKEKLFIFLYKHINQKLFEKNTLKFYKEHDYLIGKKVTIDGINGIVNGIDDDFNLIVDNKAINSGEVN